MEFLAPIAMLAIFLGLYEVLRRRTSQPVRWVWLAAIIACAGIAVLIGALTR
jgi:uncharacterized BrkB/YihY/UPF0761 family membrane protein